MDSNEQTNDKLAMGRYSKWFNSQRKTEIVKQINPSKKLAYNYYERKQQWPTSSVTKRSTHKVKNGWK